VSHTDPVVIASAVRTPLGRVSGELASFTASQLGASAIRAALTAAKIADDRVDEVFMATSCPRDRGKRGRAKPCVWRGCSAVYLRQKAEWWRPHRSLAHVYLWSTLRLRITAADLTAAGFH
jgi:3-methyladenine DNA glycosylase/8-oxoguanine DNA glycosylase